MKNQLLICKMIGGSKSYGLETPTSDTDYRGIFLNTSLETVIGLSRHDHQDIKEGGADEFYFELRHYLNLLRRTNTQVLELIFNKSWIETTPLWTAIQSQREKLLDSEKMYKSLKGYIFGELRLANGGDGSRLGRLGGKRRETLEKYGFSPKNFVQIFRLSWAGSIFYKTGAFPVNVREFSCPLAESWIDIKTNPGKYKKDDLNMLAREFELNLDMAYQNRGIDYKFDEEAANEVLLRAYFPVICKLKEESEKSLQAGVSSPIISHE